MKNTKQTLRATSEKLGETVKEEVGTSYADLADKALRNDYSVKKLSGISDTKEAAIYGQAYLMYNTGRYSEAAEIFRLLISINSLEPKYLMGLAACFHLMKEYPSAIAMYVMCGLMDIKNPVPPFHASDCFIQVGDLMSASTYLEQAVERAGDVPEFKILKEKSEITLKGIKHELENELKTASKQQPKNDNAPSPQDAE